MTRNALPVGTVLEHYVIKQVISDDGRGISYQAVDTGSVSGSAEVLVREYFPRGISVREAETIEPRDRLEAEAEFEAGLNGFVDSANVLIDLKTHTFVPALNVVEENGSAYLVLEWPKGETFSDLAGPETVMSADLLRSQLSILLPGLDELHAAGLIHTALSPHTLIRLDDGYPAITQLTHVERFDVEEINRTHMLMDTPYSAPELAGDSDDSIGPWTDIYSMSAVCWFLLTGAPPATAAARKASLFSGRGDLLSAETLTMRGGGAEQFADALLAGLALDPRQRLQSASELLGRIEPKSVLSVFTPLATFWSSHRLLSTAAVAALAVGAFWIGAGDTTSRHSDPSPVAETSIDENTLVVQLDVGPMEIDLPEVNIQEPRMIANAAWLLVDREKADDVRSYIDTYRDEPVMSVVAAERLELLDERAWSAALADGSPDAFNRYLSNFSAEMVPPGVHVGEAQDRLTELTSAEEFRIAEVRRLLALLGYKTASRSGMTPGLKRAIVGFQDTMDLETDGEITDQLLESISAEVSRREAQDKLAAEAEDLAVQEAEAQKRLVELVQSASASGKKADIDPAQRRSVGVSVQGEPNTTYTAAPAADPIVSYETSVASSVMAREEVKVESRSAEPVRNAGDTFRDCETCPELVVLPAGMFEMGSPENERGRLEDEGPVHVAQISRPFAMAKYEVTVDQFDAFVSQTNRTMPDECSVETSAHDGEWVSKSGVTFRSPGFRQTGAHPVTCVSWHDATAYVQWLSRRTGQSYRLASEAEWEYAARAGSTNARYFGQTYREGCRYANGADRTASRSRNLWLTANCRDRYLATAPVGSYRANAFGLHDMIGNVWEWTEDCFTSYTRSSRNEAAKTRAGCRSRVTRGGAWATHTDLLRSAARSGDRPQARYDMVGFRVARDLPTK